MVDGEEDKFIKENPIVFKKYKVIKKLGEGAFGDVYLGKIIANNSYVALKVEQRKIVKPILESEAFLLYSIQGLGIPEVKSFGKVKNYNILVEPLLGKSLFDIFAENQKKMPLEDVCLIGKQVIDRIQWVHSKNIVHRDIKPDNFLIGRKDPNVLYLIDFGLSKKYRSSTTNKHIRFGFTGKLTGTVRFASANALRGGEQSRRDDIESIGYMLVYFLKQKLPWQGINGNKKMERYLKIYKMKKNTKPEELCSGLFPEMTEYISYAKKLEFEQEPDYKYLRKLFSRMLKRVNNTNAHLVFSWIKLSDVPNLKNPINPASRRDSAQSRIYKKIKSSLEKNQSSDSSDSKNGSYQQVCSKAVLPSPNLKIINNNPESEFEQKTDRKLNKKLLKVKEGLNTTVANLEVTVDENVDFENERLKKGSRDTAELMVTKKKSLSKFNKNKNIKNDLENQKIINNPNNENIEINKNNKIKNEVNNLNLIDDKINNNMTNNNNDIQDNLNSEPKDNLNSIPNDNNKDNSNKFPNDNPNINQNDNINAIPNDNLEMFPNDNPGINNNVESNKNSINKNVKDINKNKFIDNLDNNNKNNDFINYNINNNKIKNIDSIMNLMENNNNSIKNNQSSNNINSINDINSNNNVTESSNNRMKTINFDGTEFTFNEPFDFKSNLNNNKINQQQTKDNEYSNNIKEEQKELDENEKNNIYALLTGNNQYKNNNNNIINIKNKNINNNNNINNSNNTNNNKNNNKNNNNINNNQMFRDKYNEDINKYKIESKKSNINYNSNKSLSTKNRKNVNYILNKNSLNNFDIQKQLIDYNKINNNQINNNQINNNLNNNKKRILIKKVKRNKTNNNNLSNIRNERKYYNINNNINMQRTNELTEINNNYKYNNSEVKMK